MEQNLNMRSQPQARPNKGTEWSFEYEAGTLYTWIEPPHVPEPNNTQSSTVLRGVSSTLPSRRYIQDFDANYNSSRHWHFDAYHAKNVLGLWKQNHYRNIYYDDRYATIQGLLDWEMRCALRGDFKMLDHMLRADEAVVVGVDGSNKAPEKMKVSREYKHAWSLVVGVYRVKRSHDAFKVVRRWRGESRFVRLEGLSDERLMALVLDLLGRERQRGGGERTLEEALEMGLREDVQSESESAPAPAPTPAPEPAPAPNAKPKQRRTRRKSTGDEDEDKDKDKDKAASPPAGTVRRSGRSRKPPVRFTPY